MTMNDLNDALGAAASGMRAQASRLRLVSENIANADTPGYHRKLISFEAAMGREADGAVTPGRVRLDRSPPEQVYDPTHPLADAEGYHLGSNVDLMIEVADAREASRSYEANLKMFEQVREMQTALMDLLRR
jgi:flagellar basal-body rod protein FlgC